jgi:hypothetical protein
MVIDMGKKVTGFEFNMTRQSRPKITDEQIKVLKEVGSDAELIGEFLAKLCWFIRHTTNATDFKLDFGIDASVIQKEKLKGSLSYKSD